APVIKSKKPTDSSVLFDAEEDLEDDDDFGDFEDSQYKTVTPAPPVAQAPPARAGGSSALVDLLGDLDFSQPATTSPVRGSQRSQQKEALPRASVRKSPVGGFGTATKQMQNKPAPAPPALAQVVDDSWDTFDDWEASIPTPASRKPEAAKGAPSSTSSTPAPVLSSAIGELSPGEQPPTNVPPPGVLLSLFPSFFADAQEKLFKPMAAQILPMRNKLLAEPATIAYLEGYLMLASVAARIIAGRKLRWKRDQLLSQGMRIGPASSRATSGMKLTGIDKGENRKEEREASDVVGAWRDQVGRLRHVISGVNQIRAGTLAPVPDLHETMPVRTLKQSEGGVPARQQCMLCGLKRDERVTAADMTVDDSFQEWWVEQVNMHRETFGTSTRTGFAKDDMSDYASATSQRYGVQHVEVLG
ncbi:serine/threonine protein kinase, partial [Didymella pomorum]